MKPIESRLLKGRFRAGLLGLALACAMPPATIGPSALVRVVDAGLELRARVDTGAEASSLHARDVRILGARVRFVVEGEDGERIALERPLHDVARVRSAAGEELRPRVRLRLALAGIEKEIPVSLRDRSAMDYRLLVGRDFLAGDFLVDVSRGGPAPPAADR